MTSNINEWTHRRFLSGIAHAVVLLSMLCAPRGLAQLPSAGYALNYNGLNQGMFFNVSDTVTDNFTVEAWVNPATTTGSHAIVYNGNTSTDGWGIYLIDGQFEALYGGVSWWGSGTVTTNVWQHVALTASGGVGSLYVNGVLMSTVVLTPKPSSSIFAVASAPQGIQEVFDGQIDEVRVWSIALTPTQVRTLRRLSLPGTTSGLFMEFHFDEGVGGLTYNNTSFGGIGALINNPGWVLSGVPYGATTTTVPSLADDGSPGTLRYCISDALAGDTLAMSGGGTLTLNSNSGPLVLNQNVTITGPGANALAIDGNNAVTVFEVQSNVVANLSGLTIQNGYASNGVAGGSTYAGGAGGAGGGVYNLGMLSLTNCVLAGNHAGNGGAGYAGKSTSDPATDGGAGGNGGAIYSPGGSVALFGCSLDKNAAGAGGTGGKGSAGSSARSGRGGSGGGGGAIYSSGALTLMNCTLSGNTAGSGSSGGSLGVILGSTGVSGEGGDGGCGGGIYSAGSLSLVSCTISSNYTGIGGAGGPGGTSAGGNGGNGGNGGGIFAASNLPGLRNTIVAGNSAGVAGAGGSGLLSAGNPGAAGFAPDLSGTFTSLGHNLIGLPAGAAGFTSGQNFDLLGGFGSPLSADLGPLQNNGGPTPTVALLPASPAINAGDDALAGFDQRGFVRPSGAHVDIGAYEFDLGIEAPPVLSDVAPGTVTTNSITQQAGTVVTATLGANPLPASVFLQYGPTTNYGSHTAAIYIGPLASPFALSLPLNDLSPGLTWHVSIVASNDAGTTYGPDLSFYVPSPYPPGDVDGAGYIDQADLNLVLSNYWTHSPWVMMTNVTGLGTTNVQFALTNLSAWSFTVEATTNFATWTPIGTAFPAYEFSDPAATNSPQRFYRLRWP